MADINAEIENVTIIGKLVIVTVDGKRYLATTNVNKEDDEDDITSYTLLQEI